MEDNHTGDNLASSTSAYTVIHDDQPESLGIIKSDLDSRPQRSLVGQAAEFGHPCTRLLQGWPSKVMRSVCSQQTSQSPTVKVVNSYAAVSDAVCVTLLSNVDCKESGQDTEMSLVTRHTFPTDGNPINATLASPDFCTSKPTPVGPDFEAGSRSCARYRASLAFSRPRWYSVAYLHQMLQ